MIYAFGGYELDLPRYELRHAGQLVKLEPQVFNLLAYLIQHRDRVVTKEELLERLWTGRFVGEATLTSRLTLARRAVGDRGREQSLIQMVHGWGYRFVAAVEERGLEAPADIGQSPLPLAHQPGTASESSTALEPSVFLPRPSSQRVSLDKSATLPTDLIPPGAQDFVDGLGGRAGSRARTAPPLAPSGAGWRPQGGARHG